VRGIESLCIHLPRHGDSIIVCDRVAAGCLPSWRKTRTRSGTPPCR
jgi:hypothetical protein